MAVNISDFIFANKDKVLYVYSRIYDYDNLCFCMKLNNKNPNLSDRYENISNYSRQMPIFYNITEIEVKKQLLNDKLPNENTTIYIKTFLKKDIINYLTHDFIKYDNSNSNSKESDFVDVVIFENNEIHDYYIDYITPKSDLSNKIFRWSPSHQAYYDDKTKIFQKNINDLIGLENYYNDILNEINDLTKYKDKLIRLGESNGFNYLLYGPPGTGKSSFVRALASKLNVPIYIANINDAGSDNALNYLLSPKTKNDNFVFVLVEDLDRYIDKMNLSALLNVLDGITPSFGVIRFFSANNPQIINDSIALKSRMNSCLFFDYPSREQIIKQVYNVFDDKKLDDKMVEEIVDILMKNINKLNMRELTHILCKYIRYDDPLQHIYTNIETIIHNNTILQNYDTNNETKDDTKDESNNKPKMSALLTANLLDVSCDCCDFDLD